MLGNLRKLSPLRTSYSLDFGPCFTFNLLKFRQKFVLRFCRRRIITLPCFFYFWNPIWSAPKWPTAGTIFEGYIFAQTVAIPWWRDLDQTLSNVHSINFTSLGASYRTTISMQEFKFWELAHRLKCYTSNLAFCCHQVAVILLPVITMIFSLATHVNINMSYVLYTVY